MDWPSKAIRAELLLRREAGRLLLQTGREREREKEMEFAFNFGEIL